MAVKLALSGVKTLALSNRSLDKAAALASQISKLTGVQAKALPWGKELPKERVAESHLVVQTTPIGMSPGKDSYPEFPFEVLQPGQLVCDLIYNPDQTCFLKLAAQRGAAVLNGIGMLLYQGVLAFELWTKEKAPVEVMKISLREQVCK
ncbi:hypothetical protein N752_09880 [Desulforamulus aquiferis]|nr:hypothetical protein [Desulforamulus aquiferis]RYD05343.1 hypothetical protein N752_09880 [Desulforamulus aquiferis]